MGETPILFEAEGARLLGILHRPEGSAKAGLVIVVGGPQYRIGAHRQFVHLARHLAAEGVAVLRFDYRGLGDSEGSFTGFENIDADIDAAIGALLEQVPDLENIVLWGLCDAASAILMKRRHGAAVKGLVVANPWVRTQAGEARTYLKHYYLRRLLSADFWRKVLGGRWRSAESLKDIGRKIGRMSERQGDLPDRVLDGLDGTPLPVLLILSGNDLVAREFEDCAGKALAPAAPRLSIERLPAADHTFSRSDWKNHVADVTLRWMSEHIPGF